LKKSLIHVWSSESAKAAAAMLRVAVCCSGVVCFSTLVSQHIAVYDFVSSLVWCAVLQCVAVCCSVLRCVAVCCGVLQCVAVCCSVSRAILYLVLSGVLSRYGGWIGKETLTLFYTHSQSETISLLIHAWEGDAHFVIHARKECRATTLCAYHRVSVVCLSPTYVIKERHTRNSLFERNTHSLIHKRDSDTEWRRFIGSPKLQINFHKRATKYRSLLRKMTYKDKGSYESSPPCTMRHTRNSLCEWTTHSLRETLTLWERHSLLNTYENSDTYKKLALWLGENYPLFERDTHSLREKLTLEYARETQMLCDIQETRSVSELLTLRERHSLFERDTHSLRERLTHEYIRKTQIHTRNSLCEWTTHSLKETLTPWERHSLFQRETRSWIHKRNSDTYKKLALWVGENYSLFERDTHSLRETLTLSCIRETQMLSDIQETRSVSELLTLRERHSLFERDTHSLRGTLTLWERHSLFDAYKHLRCIQEIRMYSTWRTSLFERKTRARRETLTLWYIQKKWQKYSSICKNLSLYEKNSLCESDTRSEWERLDLWGGAWQFRQHCREEVYVYICIYMYIYVYPLCKRHARHYDKRHDSCMWT